MTLRSVWLTACHVADAAPHAGKSTFACALTLPARLGALSSRHPLRGSNCPSCLDATRTRWRKTRGGIAAADFRLRLALGMVAGVRDPACRQRRSCVTSFAERDAAAFGVTLRSVSLTACRVADAAPHAGKSTFAHALTLPARLRALSSRHPLRGSNCPSCLAATRTRSRETRG